MDMDIEKTEVKYGIQVSERSPRHTWDIVAAFDIGTSYSGYAYSDRKEMDLKSISFNQWTGNMVSDPKAKAPTTVLFDKNMRFHSFGYEAEDFYATQVCEKKNDDWYRFKNFKMVLYREKVGMILKNLVRTVHVSTFRLSDSPIILYISFTECTPRFENFG